MLQAVIVWHDVTRTVDAGSACLMDLEPSARCSQSRQIRSGETGTNERSLRGTITGSASSSGQGPRRAIPLWDTGNGGQARPGLPRVYSRPTLILSDDTGEIDVVRTANL
jgi:hypothetical protein